MVELGEMLESGRRTSEMSGSLECLECVEGWSRYGVHLVVKPCEVFQNSDKSETSEVVAGPMSECVGGLGNAEGVFP